MPKSNGNTRAAKSAPAVIAKARAPAMSGGWVALALLHHDQIRTAFARALQTRPDGSRLTAMKGLAILLNGHSLAEEVVLYPVLARTSGRGADKLYGEQSLAKAEMAALEQLDPLGDDWAAKLEQIREAVFAHMLEEEQKWFPEIKASGANQARLLARYQEEFERYTRTGAVATDSAWDSPPRFSPSE